MFITDTTFNFQQCYNNKGLIREGYESLRKMF